MTASTIWVLWCEPEAIRSQFFVLFRKYLQDNSKNEKSKKKKNNNNNNNNNKK